MFKELSRSDRQLERLEKENEQLTDTVLQQYEYSQYLQKVNQQLKNLGDDALHRATTSEFKLANSEMLRDFGDGLQEQVDIAEPDIIQNAR
mmetsp:Transcript_23945/g.36681  ORF Transcript_23945/g.36681 Transcript_23945/m.36681 type:complete len:91 (-) Transcript_23945:2609-2881(-)